MPLHRRGSDYQSDTDFWDTKWHDKPRHPDVIVDQDPSMEIGRLLDNHGRCVRIVRAPDNRKPIGFRPWDEE